MKYLSETGLRHLIRKIFALLPQGETPPAEAIPVTNEEIDAMWEESV
ncbi:MAG: hypothetical protein J6M34_03915 [Clostridia bacterium]|nr:hypothetical protein [Clostridia bacterium]